MLTGKKRSKEVSVFMTIRKDGVVCMLMTTMGRLFCENSGS